MIWTLSFFVCLSVWLGWDVYKLRCELFRANRRNDLLKRMMSETHKSSDKMTERIKHLEKELSENYVRNSIINAQAMSPDQSIESGDQDPYMVNGRLLQ